MRTFQLTALSITGLVLIIGFPLACVGYDAPFVSSGALPVPTAPGHHGNNFALNLDADVASFGILTTSALIENASVGVVATSHYAFTERSFRLYSPELEPLLSLSASLPLLNASVAAGYWTTMLSPDKPYFAGFGISSKHISILGGVQTSFVKDTQVSAFTTIGWCIGTMNVQLHTVKHITGEQTGFKDMSVALTIDAKTTEQLTVRGVFNPRKANGSKSMVALIWQFGRDKDSQNEDSHKTDDVLDLIEQLSDENYMVRRNAAETLGSIDDSTAVLALIKALNDEDNLVRFRAAVALGKIGDSAAVPALIDTLMDKNAIVRANAARALGSIGKPAKDAVPELNEALRDEDEFVRSNAAKALQQIGTMKP